MAGDRTLRSRILEMVILVLILGLQIAWLGYRYARGHQIPLGLGASIGGSGPLGVTVDPARPTGGVLAPVAPEHALGAVSPPVDRNRGRSFLTETYVTPGLPIMLQETTGAVTVKVVGVLDRTSPPFPGGGLRATVLLEDAEGNRREADVAVQADDEGSFFVTEIEDRQSGVRYVRDQAPDRFVRDRAAAPVAPGAQPPLPGDPVRP